jgi:hypothetical protein
MAGNDETRIPGPKYSLIERAGALKYGFPLYMRPVIPIQFKTDANRPTVEQVWTEQKPGEVEPHIFRKLHQY